MALTLAVFTAVIMKNIPEDGILPRKTALWEVPTKLYYYKNVTVFCIL
jgi:hypothetical protein